MTRAFDRLRIACAAFAFLALIGWLARFGRLGPRLASIDHLGELGRTSMRPAGWLIFALGVALASAAWLRRRPANLGRAAPAVGAAALGSIAASLGVEAGHLIAFAAAAFAAAVVISLQTVPARGVSGAAEPSSSARSFDGVDGGASSARSSERGAGRGLPLALWGLVASLHALFSMHRHWAFGSGSWDLGCMVHNFYRASRGLDTVSTVLGGVDFLGDHFMVGIYLFAPLFWIDDSAWMVLALQSVSLAAAAPAIYAVARARGSGLGLSAALALTVGLGFGMQSGAYFDAHAITIGFGFLALAIWAFETDRLVVATVALVLLSTFKESLGAYVVGFGLLALVRGARRRRSRDLAFAAGWIAYGGLCFVLVNRVFIPMFIAHGRPPEPHETFADFGPTVFTALVGMLADPLKAIGALFVPEEKVLSLGVTLIGVGGGLVVLAPEIAIAALPLLAERFLSSKASMWQMGYHYAAPLTLYAGWAVALGLPAAHTRLARLLESLHPGSGGASGRTLALYLLLIGGLVNAWGYRHPANYHVWREPYFSTPSHRVDNAAAVAFVRGLGPDVRVSAQNRILPHLADRAEIWRLGDYLRADVVVLSLGESAWPYPDGYPRNLAARLDRSPQWRRVFEAGSARVYARAGEGEGEARPRQAPERQLPPQTR